MERKSKIKLNRLSKAELNERELNRLLGGSNCCVCGCRYVNQGGSSYAENGNANMNSGESGYVPADGGGGGLFGM